MGPCSMPLFSCRFTRPTPPLKIARDKRGPLDLDLPERKILLRQGRGGIHRYPARLDSHRLIEEFMILANVAAAETLRRNTRLYLPRA